MKGLQIKRLTNTLTGAVIFLAVCDLLITAAAPWWLQRAYTGRFGGLRYMLGYNYDAAGRIYPLMLAFFILSGALCLGILFAAYRILGRIQKKRPFCLKNVKSMQRAAVCGVCLCALFFSKLLYSPSILTFVCAGIFLLCSLFLMVLAALVLEAVRLKDENDLTV